MGRHSFPGSDEDDDGFASGESSYPDDADYSDPLGSFGFGDAEDDEYVDDYYDYSDDDYGTGTSTGYADADPAQYMRQGGHDEESRYQTGPFGAVARSAAGPDAEPDEPTGGHRDLDRWRRHRNDSGTRGVSVGVIGALITVIVVVGAVILWRFFGNSLSHRSADAAGTCADGDLTVAVVADPSIADHLQGFADTFNKTAKPVGDRCVSVQIKPADSDAVVSGFIGEWPAQLGQRPALWIPGSSVSAARLQASAGSETVSDSRSLVTSPVLLAVRPELKPALQKQSWASLPDLQTEPDSLDRLGSAGWGSLRLALPIGGNGDASFLAAEAVAAGSVPKDAPVTDGIGAVHRLVGGQPQLVDSSLAEALNVLLRQGDLAASPVHAVITTEQQLFTRGQALSNPAGELTSWLPPGPAPVADYPTVLLAGSWLSQEQISAASEFARFTHKPDQLAELARAGFRVEGVQPPSSEVTGFPTVSDTLSVGDEATRATLANALTTLPGSAAVTLMLDQSMTTDEGGRSRLSHVIGALDRQIKTLPPTASMGLWTFDGVEGRNVVAPGPLDEPLNGRSRAEALTGELNELSSVSGGAVSFTTLRLVYNQALSDYRAGQNNSILVITAGPHTDRTLDGAGLQEFIRANTDPERPVAVNVIDFGPDPDQSVWQAVAQLSGGTYQSLPGANTPELVTALQTLLS
ncbi:substrate-binding domain-containing protein [[Mycobacterium] kokjensenii]|uniref:Substrate-binding domain-containing protein n=1 Tax=[Mycobacterium] kokjensenii TaxID=3064287 RepID=A0ABN9MZT7_9MYCO|nr:substrate-binding domain-containing protein [Mycolicibacter sp. MU0083]CAJ1498020.1 substrate-binding domain-containing protein [Mycolicibacter sp. MU0083]